MFLNDLHHLTTKLARPAPPREPPQLLDILDHPMVDVADNICESGGW
jgi:hypothetical protein